MYGFHRVAAAVPQIKVAAIKYNADNIACLIEQAASDEVSVVVFPELAVTGYTCADLFCSSVLPAESQKAIENIAARTAGLDIVSIIGAPLLLGDCLFNAAFVVNAGKIIGVVPKSYHPNYREFYDKRWFAVPPKENRKIRLGGVEVPFGTNLLFDCGDNLVFGIELCEDLWTTIPPSSYQALAGATACFNLSASNELVAKADYRRSLVSQQSARCIGAYIYAAAGVHESTTDVVFSGHSIIAENGAVIGEGERFKRDDALLIADLDCEKLRAIRRSESSFADCAGRQHGHFEVIDVPVKRDLPLLEYTKIDPHPFVPNDLSRRKERCHEIFNIQTAGLAKRFEHTGSEKAVIGISGGLDSTLALLVCAETFELLGYDRKNIVAVTMPGFGTTDRTYNNAVEMCRLIGADLREIDIKESCLLHFDSIGHDPAVHDVTYENVQARERTKVLMNIANRERGLVIGTGDLSEIALGWSTYNGDHMSMYAVNCSIPKTLIRYIIGWEAEQRGGRLKEVLEDIIDTPVSPELLPNTGDAEINQKTEEIIGPYELHDFFLYHTVKYGAEPPKIMILAKKAFAGVYEPEFIKKYLKKFIWRFFSQQFKRSCIPDGPKVGTISLSPRGDWRMPSDASPEQWLKDL